MDQSSSSSSKKVPEATGAIVTKGGIGQLAPQPRQGRNRRILLSLLVALVVLCTSLGFSALNPAKTVHAATASASSASDAQACANVYSNTFLSDMPNPTLRFDYTPGGWQPDTQYVLLNNCGGAEIAWAAPVQTYDGGQWLTISRDHGTLNPGENALIAFDVDPSVVPTSGAIYIGAVTFYTTYAAPITVRVLFYVGP